MIALRRWAMNRADFVLSVLTSVALGVVIVLIATSSSFRSLLFGSADLQKTASAAVAAIGALLLAIIAGIVKITSARQSLTSLMASEIRAIQYGILTMDMFDFWGRVFMAPEDGALGFADSPRKEDYFQLFHSVANNVGNLHPRSVEAIVRFYSYLKMSRDAAAALNSWDQEKKPALRKLHVQYVIKILALAMNWGFVALWYMGSVCQTQDLQLLEQARTAYNQAFTDGFQRFFDEHPRSQQLKEFFHDPRPQSALSPAQAPSSPA
jgi:hypothetical protein